MTINEAIEKAKANGWDDSKGYFFPQILTDSSFWKAIGKTDKDMEDFKASFHVSKNVESFFLPFNK